jgi:hypothetical protein
MDRRQFLAAMAVAGAAQASFAHAQDRAASGASATLKDAARDVPRYSMRGSQASSSKIEVTVMSRS